MKYAEADKGVKSWMLRLDEEGKLGIGQIMQIDVATIAAESSASDKPKKYVPVQRTQ